MNDEDPSAKLIATNLDDPSKLTEFQHVDENVAQTSVYNFFQNIFSSKNQETESVVAKSIDSENKNLSQQIDTVTEPERVDPPGTRSMSIVSQRISSLLTLPLAAQNEESTEPTRLEETVTLLDYDKSSFKQGWMPDARCKECYDCNEKFTTFKRKHHCRLCGQIFCTKCSKNEIAGSLFGYIGSLRLCNYCSNAVTSYHRRSSGFSDSGGTRIINRKISFETPDSEEVPVRFDLSDDAVVRKISQTSSSSSAQCVSSTEPILSDTTPKDQTIQVVTNVLESVPDPSPQSVGGTSVRSFPFDDLEPDWVKKIQDDVSSVPKKPEQATASSDSVLFPNESGNDTLDQIDSTFTDAKDISYDKEFTEPVYKLSLAGLSSVQQNTPNRSVSSSDTGDDLFKRDPALEAFEQRQQKLLMQLLKPAVVENSQKWFSVLWPLIRDVAYSVQPNVRNVKDEMDLLKYVHVKTLAINAESSPNARLVFGTICSKTVADTRMKHSLNNPKILLIGGSIEYERVEGKFCSIDPILLQELEYMGNIVSKITNLKPNVVIVEKSVARIARTLFRENGITLIYDVKAKTMSRIARCTQADIVQCIEGQIVRPKLGNCGCLKADTYFVKSDSDIEPKNLIFFEDCPPYLSCALLLTGPDLVELKRIKRIVQTVLSLIYSAKLELALLRMLRVNLSGNNLNRCDCKLCAIDQSDTSSKEDTIVYLSPYINLKNTITSLSIYNENTMPSQIPLKSSKDPSCEDSLQQACALVQHPFFNQKIIKSTNSLEMRKDLARFRSQSGLTFRQRLLAKKLLRNDSADSTKNTFTPTGQENPTLIDGQFLTVSFCSYLSSPSAGKVLGFCLNPRVFVMQFYGDLDCCLGDYLERYCFEATYLCPNMACQSNMLNHVRKIVRGNCGIEITIQTVDIPGQDSASSTNPDNSNNPNENRDQILVWEWCQKCQSTTSVQIMSDEAWHLSFAKYLHYLFDGMQFTSNLVDDSLCKCCAFHQHIHHFSRRRTVVSFKVVNVSLHTIAFPCEISVSDRLRHGSKNEDDDSAYQDAVDQIKNDTEKLAAVIDHASDYIIKLKSTPISDKSTLGFSWQNATLTFQSIIDLMSRDDANGEGFAASSPIEIATTSSAEICMRRMTQRKIRVADLVAKWNVTVNELIIATGKKRSDDKAANLPDNANNGSPNPTAEPPLAQRLSSVSSLEGQHSSSSSSLNFLNNSERKSLTKSLQLALLTPPFDLSEHWSLQPAALGDLGPRHHPLIVRDTEWGSIVAYALSTEEYTRRRATIVDAWPEDRSWPSKVVDSTTLQPSDSSTNNDSNAWHVEVQFGDQNAKFYCKVFFAEHFRRLRHQAAISNGSNLKDFEVERNFVTSLSQCHRWTPKGGKSGAAFGRTRDRKFVLKQVSKFEMQSFQKFFQNYFHYVIDACQGKRPTALARIFGLYRVCLTNSQTTTEYKANFIVMEYIFYNRNIDQVYDLKGSVRNRLATVAPSSQGASDDQQSPNATSNNGNSVNSKLVDESVLLDVNLLRDAAKTSFYVQPEAKALLNTALSHDTAFLASNSVMDYSLLCAVDKAGSAEDADRLLVVGVIDFMRTYSWDKRLESWVKSTVTITGQPPTVISPDLYRQRFLETMPIYFPMAPKRGTYGGAFCQQHKVNNKGHE